MVFNIHIYAKDCRTTAYCFIIDELVKQSYTGKQSLFGSSDAVTEGLAQKFFAIIKEKQRLDIAAGKDFQRVDTDSIENKDI